MFLTQSLLKAEIRRAGDIIPPIATVTHYYKDTSDKVVLDIFKNRVQIWTHFVVAKC